MTRRRVTFVTGTRADFGKMLALMRAAEADADFACEIVATGMHLMRSYGYTLNEIQKAGFSSVFPIFNQDSTISQKMDLALASTIVPFSHYVSERSPDLIVIHGDRIETLAAVIVGSLNNVKVAHVEGGEVSGTIDESLRHAITKLASIHFVSNDTARRRLLQLGEEAARVHVIGSPEVDIMLGGGLPDITAVRERYQIPFTDHAILAYHPVTTEIDSIEAHADALFSAAEDSGANFVVIRPNNDLGSVFINKRIDRIRARERFRVFPSMRFEYFLSLLREARFVLGNSSSGVREAPVYGVPTVNVGSRQSKRFDYPGIVNVREDREAILAAIAGLPRRVVPVQAFGDGRAAERFLRLLKSSEIWDVPAQKRFVDRAIVAGG